MGLTTYVLTMGYVLFYLTGRVLIRVLTVLQADSGGRSWSLAARSLPTSSLILLLTLIAASLGGWALLRQLGAAARKVSVASALLVWGVTTTGVGALLLYYAGFVYWVPRSERDSDVPSMAMAYSALWLIAIGLGCVGVGLLAQLVKRRGLA